MTHIDIAGPIAALRLQALRKLDEKIAELSEEPTTITIKSSPGAYELGVLSEALAVGIEQFAAAFAQGRQDYRREANK